MSSVCSHHPCQQSQRLCHPSPPRQRPPQPTRPASPPACYSPCHTSRPHSACHHPLVLFCPSLRRHLRPRPMCPCPGLLHHSAPPAMATGPLAPRPPVSTPTAVPHEPGLASTHALTVVLPRSAPTPPITARMSAGLSRCLHPSEPFPRLPLGPHAAGHGDCTTRLSCRTEHPNSRAARPNLQAVSQAH